jgi:hypothetical protein
MNYLRGIAVGALLAALSTGAHASELFNLGSSFTVNGTNSPDSFSNTADLTAGSQLLDGGALELTISFHTSGADERVVFQYDATDGPLSQANSDWSLNELGVQTTQATNFIGAFGQLTVGGVPQTLADPIFSGYSTMSSPVPGLSGPGTGVSGFVAPFPSGPLPNLGAFMDPYGSFITAAGLDPTTVTGWTQALEFTSQTSGVPEPATWVMMLSGLLGLGIAARRRSKQAVHAI